MAISPCHIFELTFAIFCCLTSSRRLSIALRQEETFWPCVEASEGDTDHIVSEYSSVSGCGVTKTHNRHCVIVEGEKRCVCKHKGKWFHGEMRYYIAKEGTCVNKYKWWKTHLSEEERNDLKSMPFKGINYHSLESVRMHEVAAIVHDNTAVEKWDAAQCQKLMIQGAELTLGMGILAGNALVIAGLAGASVPVFGIPVILTICVLSLGVMAWSHHLSAKERRLRDKYREFVTAVQRVIIGLDSVNVILEKQNQLIHDVRSLDVDKVNIFLGSDAVKRAADPHVKVDMKNMFYSSETGFWHDYDTISNDEECRAAIKGSHQTVGDKTWMQIVDKSKRAICGTIKLLDSMHTLAIMFGNAVKTQFEEVKLPEQVDDLIQELSRFWKEPSECQGNKDAFKSEACQQKINDPEYIRKRQSVDHQLHNLHRLNNAIKVVGLVTGVGAFAAHSTLEALEGVQAAHAAQDAYIAKEGTHAIEEAAQGAHGGAHAANGAHHAVEVSDWSWFLEMDHRHVVGLSHDAHGVLKANEILHQVILGEETREGLVSGHKTDAHEDKTHSHTPPENSAGSLCLCNCE